jgi:6-phosphogluconolactonase/glucosamine-6-phosphate isomerase/deaminase
MQIRSRRFSSRAELDAALAQRLEQAMRGGAPGAPSAIMLAGGHTPLPAYRELARRRPACGPQLHLLYSDDRYVPADSDKSNYHATRPLLDALALPEERVLRVRTELPLEQAALDYERQLRELLGRGARVGLGLLGLGADGHTASLFRPQDLDRGRGRLAIAVQRPDGMAGISVTPEFLSRVAEPLFVVAGGGKFDAIRAFLREDASVVALQAVQGCQSVELWVEQAAEFSLYA